MNESVRHQNIPAWTSKIIRSSEVPFAGVSNYERDALEALAHIGSGDGTVLAATTDLFARARQEAEQKVRDAYAEGLRRGAEAGKAQFLEAVGESAQVVRAAAAAIREAEEAFLERLGPHVVELAGAIAARILEREAGIDPDVVLHTARAALEKMIERKRTVVHVHPSDLEALRNNKVTLLEEFDGLEHIDVLPDATVSRGGCVVESDTLHIDAQFHAQIAQILDALPK